jgi:septal ring factor EnvC (AmiA/AmiB activator)
MSDEVQDVRVVGIDKDRIAMSADKQSLWIVPFKLSATPNSDWERKYFEVRGRDKKVHKQQSQLSGDHINVEVSELDDLQKILEVVRAEVESTNVLCGEEQKQKQKLRSDLETLQQKQTAVTNKLKDAADKLKF